MSRDTLVARAAEHFARQGSITNGQRGPASRRSVTAGAARRLATDRRGRDQVPVVTAGKHEAREGDGEALSESRRRFLFHGEVSDGVASRLAQSAYQAHLAQTIARDRALGISSSGAKPKVARSKTEETSIDTMKNPKASESSRTLSLLPHIVLFAASHRELNVVPSVSGIAIILCLEEFAWGLPWGNRHAASSWMVRVCILGHAQLDKQLVNVFWIPRDLRPLEADHENLSPCDCIGIARRRSDCVQRRVRRHP
jgi:hypothetical protein